MNEETENEITDGEENDAAIEEKPSNIGRIEWLDLTVDDASQVKNFYCNVIGWSDSEVDMGMYSDFNNFESIIQQAQFESEWSYDSINKKLIYYYLFTIKYHIEQGGSDELYRTIKL